MFLYSKRHPSPIQVAQPTNKADSKIPFIMLRFEEEPVLHAHLSHKQDYRSSLKWPHSWVPGSGCRTQIPSHFSALVPEVVYDPRTNLCPMLLNRFLPRRNHTRSRSREKSTWNKTLFRALSSSCSMSVPNSSIVAKALHTPNKSDGIANYGGQSFYLNFPATPIILEADTNSNFNFDVYISLDSRDNPCQHTKFASPIILDAGKVD